MFIGLKRKRYMIFSINMKKVFLLGAMLCCLCFCAWSQDSLSTKQHLEDFDFAVSQVEENYSGYPTKVSKTNIRDYKALKKRLRKEIKQGKRTGTEAAGEYAAFFADWHLAVAGFKDGYFFNFCQQYYPENKQVTFFRSMDEYAPEKLACKVNDKTYLIRVPSFGQQMDWNWIANAVDSFAVSQCQNLIIDIRGNTGGSDDAYWPFICLCYDHPGLIDGVEMRNSGGNRDYWAETLQDTTTDEGYRNVLTSLLASHDEWVVSTQDTIWTLTVDTVYAHKPRKVGIIIDPIVASSGEQFLIDIKATSDRVTVFGRDNTIGCLDYSNCRVATFPNSGSIITIAMSRSFRLPDRGIDETGIAPDVHITLPYPKVLTDNIDEWVLYVAKTLEE